MLKKNIEADPELRVCHRGHKFYKTRETPVCPGCAEDRIKNRAFLQKLPAPAKRALEKAGIRTIRQLSLKTVKEIRALHGIGENVIPKLRNALRYRGLTFKR